MWKKYNANPVMRKGDDCTVRAISKILSKSWEEVYWGLCKYGMKFYDMPSANHVWGTYLLDHGYRRTIIPDTCPMCYTVREFAEEHPYGSYILALNGHVVAVKNGNYYDSWDSGNEIPIYYWEKEGES